MKKVLSVLLVLVMCASMLALTASAAESGALSVGNAEIAAGNSGTVTVNMTSNPGVAYMAVSASAPSGFTVSLAGHNGFNTSGNKAYLQDTAGTTVTGSILTATISVGSDVAPGTYSVVFTVTQAWDANEEAVPFGSATATITVPAPVCDHSYATTTEATCGAAGTKTCSKCGATESIPATGNHNYEVVTAATCATAGQEKCSGCGATKEIPATGNHTYEVETAATCGADGLKKCSGCGATQVIPATGEHDYQPKTPATCVAKGENECSGCGAIEETPIDPDNHKDENGDKVCDDCNEDLKCVHKWDDGEVTKKPTCDEKGEKTYTCKLCQETKTEEIKAKGHKWEWIVDKKATGSSTGLKHEECSECGKTRNEGTVIPKIQGLDNVPQTGDITNQITMAVASVVIMMVAAVAFVFKRKAAK